MTAQASATRYGLPVAAVARIQATLAAFPAIEQATLYGSRALGRHRPGSDIDLTLSGVDLDPRTLARLDAALDDLLLQVMQQYLRLIHLHANNICFSGEVWRQFEQRGTRHNGSPTTTEGVVRIFCIDIVFIHTTKLSIKICRLLLSSAWSGIYRRRSVPIAAARSATGMFGVRISTNAVLEILWL